MRSRLAVVTVCAVIIGCAPSSEYDVLIRGGTVYDGSGGPPLVADVAISGDTVAAVGSLRRARVREITPASIAHHGVPANRMPCGFFAASPSHLATGAAARP